MRAAKEMKRSIRLTRRSEQVKDLNLASDDDDDDDEINYSPAKFIILAR
jgi:hypothetical protein